MQFGRYTSFCPHHQQNFLMFPDQTSYATSITEVRSASTRLPVCYYNTLLHCDYFSSLSVVPCTFSVLCVYPRFGHHPHPIGYICAKFRFFRYLHCWASPRRKIMYSINLSISQSLTQLIWCPGNQSSCTSELIPWLSRSAVNENM